MAGETAQPVLMGFTLNSRPLISRESFLLPSNPATFSWSLPHSLEIYIISSFLSPLKSPPPPSLSSLSAEYSASHFTEKREAFQRELPLTEVEVSSKLPVPNLPAPTYSSSCES